MAVCGWLATCVRCSIAPKWLVVREGPFELATRGCRKGSTAAELLLCDSIRCSINHNRYAILFDSLSDTHYYSRSDTLLPIMMDFITHCIDTPHSVTRFLTLCRSRTRYRTMPSLRSLKNGSTTTTKRRVRPIIVVSGRTCKSRIRLESHSAAVACALLHR